MEQNRQWKKIRCQRGAIFLETALVLPIFMTILCFCIDLPRIMSARQRLAGASRMVAEIRARNNGSLTSNSGWDSDKVLAAQDIKNFFFADFSDVTANDITIEAVDKKASLFNFEDQLFGLVFGKGSGAAQVVEKIIDAVLDIVTAGNSAPYLTNVFEADVYYSGQVTIKVPTLLPEDTYKVFTGTSGPNPDGKAKISGKKVYMPSCQSCKYTGLSFVSAVVQEIDNIIHGKF